MIAYLERTPEKVAAIVRAAHQEGVEAARVQTVSSFHSDATLLLLKLVQGDETRLGRSRQSSHLLESTKRKDGGTQMNAMYYQDTTHIMPLWQQ